LTKTDPARGSRSLKSRAIAALARRDYSRLELARKLSEHEPDEQVVASLLDELTQKKIEFERDKALKSQQLQFQEQRITELSR
jgi:hypothetical protein